MGDDDESQSRWTITRLGMAIFFTMNVMVFTLVLWTWNIHDVPMSPSIVAFREILRYACLLFSAPVLILLGGPLLESCLAAWRARLFTTDVLLLIGVGAAFGYSTVSLVLRLPDVYFEVSCMILVAVTLGKWLEATAKQKATKTLRSLRQLLPESVRVVTENSESVVSLAQVQVGDRLRILPGERIPVDGVVENVDCTVDEQVITGESIPRSKQRGESVFGGSLNLSREVYIKSTSSAEGGAISRLAKAVEAATSAKNCRAIRLADRLAAGFIPLIVCASLLAFGLQARSGIQEALMASLSVVLIACPCALGIATPMALWVAINAAARHGVLFRNGDAVINLSKVRSVGLDKTGTVTSGEIHVAHEYYTRNSCAEQVRQAALRLASSSNHVLAKAVVTRLSSECCAVTNDSASREIALRDVQDHAGKGITAQLLGDRESELVGEREVPAEPVRLGMLGSLRFARELGMTLPSELATEVQAHSEHAIVCVGWNDSVQGVFLLGDTMRSEATDVIARLKELHLPTVILTGDTAHRASAMERLTGIQTIGQLLPEEKCEVLRDLPQPAAMVGDGINDALALAKADVGIAMDCGADVSRDASDVCLMGSTLANLPWAILLARDTRKAIRRNLFWAVGYNIVGIGFAVTGNLNPIIAAIAMVGSSIFVLTNSLSLAVQANDSSPLTQAFDHEITDARQSGIADENTLGEPTTSDAESVDRGAQLEPEAVP